MVAKFWGFHKFCMDNNGKKILNDDIFKGTVIGEYKDSANMILGDLKTLLDWCSFAYAITIPDSKSLIPTSLAKT